MTGPVRHRLAAGIATVTIDDPDRRNVLTPAVVEGLSEALAAVDGARCLLLRGEGETFCAGGDLVGLVSHAEGDLSTDALLARLEQIDELIERLYRFPAPTVAAIDGPAYATGGALVLACDLAVASEDAGIGFGFGRLGLAPAGGTSVLLPRVVGPSTARELLFGGELLEPKRAARLGLFDRVAPSTEFSAHVASLVDGILTDELTPIRETKQLLTDPGVEPLGTAMAAERASQRRLVETDTHVERVRRFLEGGRPATEP